jgi:tetraacyldisaccharide 4'-kinase
MPKLFLYPLSALYAIGVYFRNRMYDMKILRSTEFNLPVISVGNITVGGTGKTPHIEYLTQLLKDKFNVAALSRGYKRKTSGFNILEAGSSVSEGGDEPVQIKNKFPKITVAVCENRVTGVQKLLESAPTPDVILLDDAYQHRRITPGINILLVDYNRPIDEDLLLPAGRLREGSVQIRRANVIIITKCPNELTPIMRRILQKNVSLKPYQSLYFTTLAYGKLTSVFAENQTMEMDEIKDYSVVLVTGIATNTGIKNQLSKYSKEVIVIEYPDHHTFSDKDIVTITERIDSIQDKKRIIVTTEKDTIRLREIPGLEDQFKELLFYLPIQIKFLEEQGALFNQKILNYVGENKSNLSLHKRKAATNP